MLDYVYLQTFGFLHQNYLRNTMGQTGLRRVAIINIKRSYANRILQELVNRIIDIIGKRKNRESFLFKILEP